MNCYVCRGVDTIEEGLVRFCPVDAPDPYFVENIPAKQCYQCGEKVFSTEAVKVLDFVSDEAQPARMRSVRVYDYALLKEQLAARSSSA